MVKWRLPKVGVAERGVTQHDHAQHVPEVGTSAVELVEVIHRILCLVSASFIK